MLARDNLKIKTIAKYKTIREGDMHLYQDIENQMVDLAMCKAKAFEDSSIEEYERAIESDLEERGLNNPDNNFGRRSDDSELLHSVASSQNYWQKLVDKRQIHKERGRSLLAHDNQNFHTTKQKTLEKRQIRQGIDEAEKKITAMEKAHEVALRTLRKTSRKSQLEFFKVKSEHVMRVFKQEQMYMVDEYFQLKQKENRCQIKINKQARQIS